MYEYLRLLFNLFILMEQNTRVRRVESKNSFRERRD